MNDHDIVDRLRLGEQGAFAALFRSDYAQLVGVAESMLREPVLFDKDIASEIASNAALVKAAGIPIGGAQ